jgi:YD repeat-containing protein
MSVPHWKPRAIVMEVIKVEYLAGAGVSGDPARPAWVYYDLEGNLIAEHDPYSKEEPPCTPTK